MARPQLWNSPGKICELENGYRTIITPGGQGAISLINLALLKSGDHILIPENVYTPNRQLARNVLRRFGVEASFYPPEIGSRIKDLLRENTRLIWCENPGSITMEVQDVPAIAEAAHAHGALVALDNTWSAGVYFDAFAHGADITMQALTKYVGGHSDVLLGSVTVKDPKLYQQLGATQQLLGSASSPDDCSLALRGMRTLAVRLKYIEASACGLRSGWRSGRRLSACCIRPWRARPGTKSGSGTSPDRQEFFPSFSNLNRQKLKCCNSSTGWSCSKSAIAGVGWRVWPWPTTFSERKGRPDYGHRIVRLNIGLEDTEDLIEDLDRSLGTAWRK